MVYTSYANFLSYQKAIKEILEIDIVYVNERFNKITLLQLEHSDLMNKYDRIIALKKLYYKEYLYTTKVNIHLLDMINNLKNQRLILVTNGEKDRVELTLNYHNLQKYFNEKYYIDKRNKYTNKYVNALNYIYVQDISIDINNIVIFENDNLEILQAIVNGFNPHKIFTIPIKIYTGEIYE